MADNKTLQKARKLAIAEFCVRALYQARVPISDHNIRVQGRGYDDSTRGIGRIQLHGPLYSLKQAIELVGKSRVTKPSVLFRRNHNGPAFYSISFKGDSETLKAIKRNTVLVAKRKEAETKARHEAHERREARRKPTLLEAAKFLLFAAHPDKQALTPEARRAYRALQGAVKREEVR